MPAAGAGLTVAPMMPPECAFWKPIMPYLPDKCQQGDKSDYTHYIWNYLSNPQTITHSSKGVPEFKLSQQDGLPCPFCGGVGAASAEFWDNYFSGKA